ncbi:7075_t:CDS:2 [Paraglomus brasilianum]|uniref:7075_t:CDS:1 n=1 Tax=Paraglomus brasilianum TaxID=144538 RepID=A0A9N8YXE2_9GLOM|nr:7075_t:CDS:2 [Paraglomus brasilianum]
MTYSLSKRRRQSEKRADSIALSKFFTPRHIHLWLRIIHSIYPVDDELVQALNGAYTDKNWIEHRIAVRDGAKEVREWSKDETSFVESFLKYEPSPPLFHALAAIIYRSPTLVMEKWQSLSSSSSSRKLPLSTEKSASILASNPHKRRSSNEPKKGKAKKKEPLSSAVMENIHSLQTEIIKQIESLPLVDETFREMWDPSVETVAHDQPLFDIVNDIDDEKLLWLEVIEKSVVHFDVDEPDPQSTIICDCQKNCANWEDCVCRAEDTGGYPFTNGRLTDVKFRGPVYECGSSCPCGEDCSNRFIQNSKTWPHLQIYKTRSKGWGVRTTKPIPKGQFVAEYVGELISAETANLRAGFYNILHHVYWFDLDFGVENDRDPTMLSSFDN